MTIEEEAFQKCRPDFSKFEAFGFIKKYAADAAAGTQGSPAFGGAFLYVYTADFCDGDFRAEIRISDNGSVSGTVTDLMSEEEYFPLRIPSQTGSYVSTVRYEYGLLLKKIRDACFIPLPFVSDQANRITAAVFSRYGELPDFPFEEEPYASSGVFRNPENRKWYGVVMRIDRNKLAAASRDTDPDKKKQRGKSSKEKQKTSDPAPVETDILNLKIDESSGVALRAEAGIYPAWHMNHKSWISVCLDDTLSDERILELVDISRGFTLSKKAGTSRPAGCRNWIVPANPKYYDLVPIFDSVDETHWKQGKGIEEGDIVYMYVAVPYSAILYKCLVTKAHIPCDHKTNVPLKELMNVRILRRYDKHAFGLKTVMKDFGVVSVRGPRFMPEELIKYIEAH